MIEVSTELEGVTLKRLLDTTYDSEMPKPKKKRQMQKKVLTKRKRNW